MRIMGPRFLGYPFTYDNGHIGERNVRVRLDRACADEGWRELFPAAQVVHLASSCSDHCPIVVRLALEDSRRTTASPRYEIMWERHPALSEVVASGWRKSKPAGNLAAVRDALHEMMNGLRAWSKKNFGHVTELEKLRSELVDLQLKDADRSLIRQKMAQLNELLYREEMMWLQRSRITWLKEGERNTAYLHRRAVWRARRNYIQRLRRTDGSWCSSPSDMERMATSYFKEVYTKDPTLNPDVVLEAIGPKVTGQMNAMLCAPFTEEEVSNALFQIGPLKAPGTDGFPARFYQRNWAALKSEITAVVLEFFVSGSMPEGVNDTAIVLIPKVPHPKELKDFRPISLCNVIYKLVSKCLVNRLRPCLSELISENQSAFIPGRLISDNSILPLSASITYNR